MGYTPSRRAWPALLAAAGAAMATMAQAQPVDAGSLSRALQDNATVPGSVPRVVSGRRGAEGAVLSVHVEEFVVEGATSVPAEAVREALAPFRGRTLNGAELLQACEAVAAVYRREGKLARVFVPAQSSPQGRLRIEVVEARLAGVRVEGQTSRVDAAFVERVVRQPLGDTRPLNIAALERGILIANDLPGVVADGVLEAGDAPGETVLRLRISDGPAWQAAAGASNWGSRSTGEEQLLLSASRSFARGEQLSTSLVASSGMQALRGAGELPLGASGLRAEASASRLQYHLGREYRELDAHGDASTVTLGLSYPLLRSQDRTLRLAASAEHSRYDDLTFAGLTRRRTVDALAASASGDWADSVLGSSLTRYAVQARAGHLGLGVAEDEAVDAASARTSGRFGVLGLNLARNAAWDGGWAGGAGLRMQWASRNLDSAEKFALGGPAALRAYPANEAAGDAGWTVSATLRRQLAPGWSLGLFADAGYALLHKSPWAAGARGVHLQDVGASVEWRGERVSADLSLAMPLARNPLAADSERNQDGSPRATRLWWRLQYAL